MECKIEFVKDFAIYKKKQHAVIDSVLASNLIRRGVAKLYKEPKKKSK